MHLPFYLYYSISLILPYMFLPSYLSIISIPPVYVSIPYSYLLFTFLPHMYLPSYLSFITLPPIYVFTFLSIYYFSFLPYIYLPSYLYIISLSSRICIYLPIYLLFLLPPIYVSTFLSIYLRCAMSKLMNIVLQRIINLLDLRPRDYLLYSVLF